jgi:hypothetical protein
MGKRNRISVPRPSPEVAERIAAHAVTHRELVEQREIAAATKVSVVFSQALVGSSPVQRCSVHTHADSSSAAVVQRARKEADKAAGKLADEEKKEEEPETPAIPEIVVPPAPTDDEVEEAKRNYEATMKVLKDELSRLQGEKTKLFQLLKQQCAADPPFMLLCSVWCIRQRKRIQGRLLS